MNEKGPWQFIRQNLYAMKRQQGIPVRVYKLHSVETDYQTGVKALQRTLHDIRRAIMLPKKIFHKETDLSKTVFVFDAEDLPDGFQFDLDDHVLVDGDYFKVTEIAVLNCDMGWVITTQCVKGADLAVILESDVETTLPISQEAGQ